jgi:hypothetical protein
LANANSAAAMLGEMAATAAFRQSDSHHVRSNPFHSVKGLMLISVARSDNASGLSKQQRKIPYSTMLQEIIQRDFNSVF